VDRDSYERILTCLKMLTEHVDAAVEVYLQLSRDSFAQYLSAQQQLLHSQQKRRISLHQ